MNGDNYLWGFQGFVDFLGFSEDFAAGVVDVMDFSEF
jgi:hypothetical protein